MRTSQRPASPRPPTYSASAWMRAAGDSPRGYPDFGCSYETFTNNEFLELETLGTLANLKPGAAVEHMEHWTLHKNVKIAAWTDAELDRVLLPLVK